MINKNQSECSICKEIYSTWEFDPKKPLVKMMVERNICFSCAFWSDKIENPIPYREIVNGGHYVFDQQIIKGEVPYFSGHGGRWFYALKNDGSLVKSNNVWYQGEIPEIFQEKLPDTAQFISRITFSKMCNNNFKCPAKGCWDRYHCARYDISIEEKDGPWNVIPKSHKVGDEMCESFINKNKL